jgi:hypothetical protein
VFGYIVLCKLVALLNVLLGLIGSDLLEMVVGVENWAGTRAAKGQQEDTVDAETEEKRRKMRIGHSMLL